jgi:putative restriction endonuclease
MARDRYPRLDIRADQPLLARLDRLAAPSGGARYGAPILHRPRLGQAIFRVQVLDAYGRACAVSSEHSLPVLEATHIQPYARGGEHDVANALHPPAVR